MSALPTAFPRVPLKQMDPSMLVFELDRETARLMPEHAELITSAATMASYLHRDQTRMVRGDLPRVPYIEHPLRVALRLVRWGVTDAELIAAALLHDVLEDCDEELVAVFGHAGETSAACMERLYGNHVARLVVAVTNPTDGTSYLEHITGIGCAQSEALLIKASDLKDNAGSIPYQLGHGRDEKLLRMVGKYTPAVDAVAEGLDALSARLRSRATVYGRAERDMLRLTIALREVASEHNLPR